VTDELTPFSKALLAEIDARRGGGKRKTPTQEQMATAVGKTQPYVSARVNGEHPWSTEDLDKLAPLLGAADAFELIAAASARVSTDELSQRRNVRRSRKDLESAPLDSTQIAASKDNTPVDPERGDK
jgi:transcriptional regulator with XRE-family HTH domain